MCVKQKEANMTLKDFLKAWLNHDMVWLPKHAEEEPPF